MPKKREQVALFSFGLHYSSFQNFKQALSLLGLKFCTGAFHLVELGVRTQ
jgi:hypothetical protein